MKELLRKFENLWVSVAFAEAGEYEASKEFLDHDVCNEVRPEILTAA
jgi:hypothetical protein